MTAIITEKTRRNLANHIFDDVGDDSNEYFICIGRSEDWPNEPTASTPSVSEREERLFRYSLQAVKRVQSNFKYVIPKTVWTNGTIYSQYNDNVVSHPTTSYYVLTSEKRVYICIKQGKDTNGTAKVSTNVPSHTSPRVQSYVDGYTWRYMYTISTDDYDNFVTSAYMPIGDADTDSAAPGGQILGYRVIDGGSSFTSTPTVTIIGDGDSAEATAAIFGNQIVDVYPTDTSSYGNSYNYANVVVTGGGGSGADVVPIFGPGPDSGLGADPKIDLRASAVMMIADFNGDGDGDLVLNNDYRQVGVIKNMKKYGGNDSDITDVISRALKYMTVSTVTNFEADNTIEKTETAGTAKAYVDYVDTTNLRVWYHQTETTGFIDFTTGSGLTSSGGGTATISSLTNPEVDIHTGDVLYIDNREAIDRTIESNDDIKIVFQI